jgi:hypothetical protein
MIEIQQCPRCGSDLEAGRIAGQMRYLMWLKGNETVGLTTWGKEHLAKGTFTDTPSVTAARCRSCGLGLFETPPSP